MRVQVRRITRRDNSAIERIIKDVMPEFGATAPGFAIHDPDVIDMFAAYDAPRSVYLVCDVNGQVVGGGGIAPLKGGDDSICELQKMYFLPSVRGKGYGNMLLQACLRAAKDFGYKQCYIETFHTMSQAIAVYEKSGFKPIPAALGNTGHFACDMFFLMDLESAL